MRSGTVVELERLLDLLQRPVAGGQVAGPLGLVQRQRLSGVAGHGLLERLLVAALRHPDRDPAAAQVAEQLLEGRGRPAAAPAPGSRAGSSRRGSPAYSWSRKRSTRLGGVALVDPVGDPAALAADPAAADVEDLHRHLERVLGERDHVGVGAVAEHHRLLLQRPVQRAEVVAEPGGLLEVQRLGGGVHLLLDPLDERRGLAAHEVAEVVDDRAVLLGADLADAGRRALVDVAEQARPADLRRTA